MHTIYLIRHGETTVFKKGLIAGATDVPLSRTGVQQMQAVADFLADKPISAIYSSPLRRAAEPAAELALARHIPHSEIMDFSEIDFGEWEGKSWEELARLEPQAFARAKSGSPLFTFPEGENVEYFRRRVQIAFAHVVRLTPGPAVIYAHGGTLRMILAAIQGLTVPQAQSLEISPGSISILEPGKHSHELKQMNIISHLNSNITSGT